MKPEHGDRPYLSRFDFVDKRCGVNDLNTLKVLDVPQVGITGDDIIRLSFQGAGKKFVVRWVVGYPVGFVDVFGDNGLSEYQSKESFEGLVFWLESLLDSGVMQDSVDLPDDVDGSHQNKVLVDPVLLEFGRYRISAEQSADKQVCVHDRSKFILQPRHPVVCPWL